MDGCLEDGTFGTPPFRVGVVMHRHAGGFGEDGVIVFVGEDWDSYLPFLLCFAVDRWIGPNWVRVVVAIMIDNAVIVIRTCTFLFCWFG